jgi:tRNA U34 5-methylaminomethyl-2-thiouridine-forming methyltransferase MnmC
MEPTITDDKSVTFYSEEFDEFYHSKSGALEEAFLKFAQASKISEVDKKIINILDICFGLGYNTLAGIAEASKNSKIKEVNVVAIELDPKILEQTKDITLEPKEINDVYNLVKEVITDSTKDNIANRISTEYKDMKINIQLYVEDARPVLKKLNKKQKETKQKSEKNQLFDYIFHDPFSPKKCPVLWTEEFFKDVYDVTKKGGMLTTYSCARVTRENLTSAGFKTEDGPKVWRRGPATIARKL